MSTTAGNAGASVPRGDGAAGKTEKRQREAMLERSHWWLAAIVILIGTGIPFAVNEIFGVEPDAGFVFFVWCAIAAAVVAAAYGIWLVATRRWSRSPAEQAHADHRPAEPRPVTNMSHDSETREAH